MRFLCERLIRVDWNVLCNFLSIWCAFQNVQWEIQCSVHDSRSAAPVKKAEHVIQYIPAVFFIWAINDWRNFPLFVRRRFFREQMRMSESNRYVGKRMYQYLWLSFSKIQIKPRMIPIWTGYNKQQQRKFDLLCFLRRISKVSFLPRSLNKNECMPACVYVAQNMAINWHAAGGDGGGCAKFTYFPEHSGR